MDKCDERQIVDNEPNIENNDDDYDYIRATTLQTENSES